MHNVSQCYYTVALHLIEDIHSKMKTLLSESNYQQQDLNTIKDDLGALKFGFAILQHSIKELIADSMSQNNMINHIISHVLPLQIDQIETTTAEFQAHVQTVSMTSVTLCPNHHVHLHEPSTKQSFFVIWNLVIFLFVFSLCML